MGYFLFIHSFYLTFLCSTVEMMNEFGFALMLGREGREVVRSWKVWLSYKIEKCKGFDKPRESF